MQSATIPFCVCTFGNSLLHSTWIICSVQYLFIICYIAFIQQFILVFQSFRRLYRDVLKRFNMLYNQLKKGVCLGWLRSTFIQSIFENVSLWKTERTFILRTWAEINLKIKDHCPYQWFHWKEQEGREQGTPHACRDMLGVSPVICSPEGVAGIYLFPNRFVFELFKITMKGRNHQQ